MDFAEREKDADKKFWQAHPKTASLILDQPAIIRHLSDYCDAKYAKEALLRDSCGVTTAWDWVNTFAYLRRSCYRHRFFLDKLCEKHERRAMELQRKADAINNINQKNPSKPAEGF